MYVTSWCIVQIYIIPFTMNSSLIPLFLKILNIFTLRDLYTHYNKWCQCLPWLVSKSTPAWFHPDFSFLIHWVSQLLRYLYSEQNPIQHKEESHYSSRWRGFLSGLGVSVPSGLHIRSRQMIQDKMSVPKYVFPSMSRPENLHTEWSLPAYINMFLPEFPHRNVPGHENFQVRRTALHPTHDPMNCFIIDDASES